MRNNQRVVVSSLQKRPGAQAKEELAQLHRTRTTNPGRSSGELIMKEMLTLDPLKHCQTSKACHSQSEMSG